MLKSQPSSLSSTIAFLLTSALTGCGGAAVEADEPAEEEEAIRCEGINECKGTSECKSSDGANECKGLNECAGQGWIYTDTEEECEDAGGAVL